MCIMAIAAPERVCVHLLEQDKHTATHFLSQGRSAELCSGPPTAPGACGWHMHNVWRALSVCLTLMVDART